MKFSNIFRKWFWVILPIAFYSCENVVEIPVPNQTPKLALQLKFGNVTPDSVFLANNPFMLPYVGRSQGILTNEPFKPVTDANLTITDAAGKVVETYKPQDQNSFYYMGPGYYQPVSHFTPQPGQQYTLTASASGFETVTGKLTLPNLVSGLQAAFTPTTMQPYGMEGRLNFSFADNGTENNYYIIYGLLLDGAKNPFPANTFSEIEDKDQAIPELNEIHFSDVGYDSYRPFDDKSFQGKTPTVSRNVSLYSGQQGNQARYLRIVVRSITQDYYRFLKTLELYYETNDNPFSQPASVRGNLTNGYGYFGGFTDTSIDILLP